jgi:hypothetical protein
MKGPDLDSFGHSATTSSNVGHDVLQHWPQHPLQNQPHAQVTLFLSSSIVCLICVLIATFLKY